jgi:glutamyl-tRNA reductase
LGLKYAPLENLKEEIAQADIILVATNAVEPTILKDHLENGSDKLIIDLSIPYNVEEAAQCLPNVRLVNVDELSKLKDETLKKREGEIPKAKEIIAALMNEFTEWNEMRKHVPLLKEVKLKLKEIHTHPLFTSTITYCTKERDANIQRALNDMACKIRLQNRKGCQYIEAINHFIKAGVTK